MVRRHWVPGLALALVLRPAFVLAQTPVRDNAAPPPPQVEGGSATLNLKLAPDPPR